MLDYNFFTYLTLIRECLMNDIQYEQISYAKTVYGRDEIDAVVKCLSESNTSN